MSLLLTSRTMARQERAQGSDVHQSTKGPKDEEATKHTKKKRTKKQKRVEGERTEGLGGGVAQEARGNRSEGRGKPRKEHEGEGALVDGGRGWRQGRDFAEAGRGLGRRGCHGGQGRGAPGAQDVGATETDVREAPTSLRCRGSEVEVTTTERPKLEAKLGRAKNSARAGCTRRAERRRTGSESQPWGRGIPCRPHHPDGRKAAAAEEEQRRRA